MIRFRQTAAPILSLALMLGLGACSTVQDVLSTDREETVEGETIAVLSLEEEVRADPRISQMPVRLPNAFTNDQWPQPGGAPTNAMQHLTLDGQLNRVWQRSAGVGNASNTRLTASPVMANGKVFVLDAAAQVFALDALTGQRVWQQQVRGDGEARRWGFGGGVAFAGDRVIVTTGFGDVFALNEVNGDELWHQEVGVPVRTAATVVGARAFFVTTDNQLIAMDTSNGNVLWTQRPFTESAGLLSATSPAATTEVVVAPFTSGELDAVRIQTGSLAWSDQLTRTGNFTPLANINAIAARPVIYDGRVYAISHSGRFVAIDLRTGERIWSTNVGSTQPPWIAGNFAYVVTLDGQLLCISTRDGRIRWLTQLDRWRNERRESGGIQYVGPVLISERLVVISSEGTLEEYSPYTGEFIDSVRVGDPVSLPPIVADNTLYVYTDDADLIAFRGEGDNRQHLERQRINELNAEGEGGGGGFRLPWIGGGNDAEEGEEEPAAQPAPEPVSDEVEDEEGEDGGGFRWPWSSR
jgi:outer membrane protein assembly factor BamB